MWLTANLHPTKFIDSKQLCSMPSKLCVNDQFFFWQIRLFFLSSWA